MIFLSIQGVFRMILIIIGVLVVVRFFSRVMLAKKSTELKDKIKKENEAFKRAKEISEQNKGKIRVTSSSNHDAEDVDYEEVKE